VQKSTQVTVADRLGSTLFIAALVHGVVILGVTFTAGSIEEPEVLPSLNVTLVVDTAGSDEPVDSNLFAARNLKGAGSAAEGERPTTALGAGAVRDQLGEPRGADPEPAAPQTAPQASEHLTAREAAAPRRAEDAHAAAAEPLQAATLVSQPFERTLAAEVDERAQAPRQDERELIATPSTRESALAPYLESWRRRVERVGTVNFPYEIGAAADRRPTLEVAIAADGRLRDIVVRRSSGDAALDQAALTILRLAAPFEPLPEAIRRDYDVLRFAYEWEFLGGRRPAAN